MAAYQAQNKKVSSCKCGPDYIDPMFHKEVLGGDTRRTSGDCKYKKICTVYKAVCSGKMAFPLQAVLFLISFYIMMSDCFVSDKMIFYICLKSVGFNRFGIRIAGK